MHHYPFNPSAYNLSTAHWTEDRTAVECERALLRDLAYRRLLDLYYGEEEPIPSKTQAVSIKIRMLKHEDIVALVLREKFKLVEGFWVQGRAEQEIQRYQRKAEAARANGALGGRPPKLETHKNPAGSDPVATRTRTRTTLKTPLPPEGEVWWLEFWNTYPRKEGKPAALKAFAKALTVAPSFQAVMDGLRRYLPCAQWQDKTKIPHPATWLNREGWNDTPAEAPVKGATGGGPVNWWDTKTGVLAKGVDLRVPAPADDTAASWYTFMAAVWLAAGPGEWVDHTSLAYPRYKRLLEVS